MFLTELRKEGRDSSRVISMKKDRELTLVIRLGRWVFFVLGTLLAGGYVAHRFKEWFL